MMGLAAIDLDQRDDRADLLQRSMLTEPYTGPPRWKKPSAWRCSPRYYECVTDHGVEITRHVVYMVTGHPAPES